GVLFRDQLFAFVRVTVSAASPRAGDAATVSRVGIPLDDSAGIARVNRLSGGGDPRRPHEQPPDAGRAGLQLSCLPRAKDGLQQRGSGLRGMKKGRSVRAPVRSNPKLS